MDPLLSAEDHIPNREALAAFLARLREDHAQHGTEWENQTLDRFLEALGAWIADAQGSYTYLKQDLPLEGDWTFFARALSAARIYE
ncbi:hypothetical protein ACFRCW_37240 [Streptomyces sp. NPDC056653]|uniref:DUF7660 family protein n=1 Tax=Streptomyces sp. NPDC056653 TaxID=3345894 RepID=UPI0036860026